MSAWQSPLTSANTGLGKGLVLSTPVLASRGPGQPCRPTFIGYVHQHGDSKTEIRVHCKTHLNSYLPSPPAYLAAFTALDTAVAMLPASMFQSGLVKPLQSAITSTAAGWACPYCVRRDTETWEGLRQNKNCTDNMQSYAISTWFCPGWSVRCSIFLFLNAHSLNPLNCPSLPLLPQLSPPNYHQLNSADLGWSPS